MNKSQQTHSKHIISKNLNNLITRIQEQFPNLNWGGCGAFAVLLGDILDKYHIKYQYIVQDPNYLHKDTCKEIYPNKINRYYLTRYFISFKHVYIKIDNIDYNTCPVINEYDFVIDDDLKHLFKNNIRESIGFGRHCWNPSFDLNDIRKIRYKLNQGIKNCIKD